MLRLSTVRISAVARSAVHARVVAARFAAPRSLMRALVPLVAASLIGAARAPSARERTLPPIVFVSRRPLAEPGAIPGLGPRQRAAAPGGRLLLRESDGRVRALLPEGMLFDVSHPAISPDARHVAFAGTTHPDSGWRLWLVDLAGGAPRPLSGSSTVDRHPPRVDDLEPCWLDDSTLVFATTHDGWRAQYDGTPVAQLWRLDLHGGMFWSLTSERNGVASPTIDPRTGAIVYSRWWFNRWRPARESRDGVSVTDDALAAATPDSANLWQVMTARPSGAAPRLFVGAFTSRRDETLAQPAVGADGAVLGTVGDALGLSPRPGATEVVCFTSPHRPPRHVAGARFDRAHAPGYGSARGLASPSACSPAWLPDGRMLLSLDRGGRGDFGIWVMDREGADARLVLDLPGTLELDAAPVVARPVRRALARAVPRREPRRDHADRAYKLGTFRLFDRDVFAGAPFPRATEGVRIRIWASYARGSSSGGDTLVLVREGAVAPDGRVDEPGLPPGVPMFEQLVDADGRVLRGAMASAHVAGYNSGSAGETTSCVGCHRGHSIVK